jgi:D-alanine-D-alanine ligase
VLRIPCTGSPAEALFLTNNKLLTKRLLRQAGLATPDWVTHDPQTSEASPMSEVSPTTALPRFILKPVSEHASFGLEEDSIVHPESRGALQPLLQSHSARLGRACYAEQYVAGREFNLSVLAGPSGPEILPPAEIDFSAFPPGKPHIVGYRAKWEAGSFEFDHTPHRFEFPPADRPLLDRLADLALKCWQVFELRGYARVDFRVDAAGEPWVLEINANPCLSPDAGFYAALERGALGFEEGIARILQDAILPNAR